MGLPRLNNEMYFKASVLFLLFLLLVFDRDMALIYILILVGDFIWYRFDKNITFPLERRTDNRFSSLLEVGIATAIFFIISSAAVKLAAVDMSSSFQSILSLLATSTPILAGNKMLTIIGWGILIPIIETSFFFGRVFEGIATFAGNRFSTNISLQKITMAVIMVILVIASFFTLFHLTAKNLASIPLLITFIFACMSCILVIRNQHLREAILLHITVNTLAVLNSFGMLSF